MMFSDMTVVLICCGGYRFVFQETLCLTELCLSIQMWSQQAIALSEKFCSSKSFMLRENKTEKLNKTRIFTFFFGQAMK